RREEGKAKREEAEKEYRSVRDAPRATRAELAGRLAAFWKLHLLYQRASQYELAMNLIGEETKQWAGGLIEPRLNTEQGTLMVLRFKYERARVLLGPAVGELEAQSPVNLLALPPALLNLAVAELGDGNATRAEVLAGQCLQLYA